MDPLVPRVVRRFASEAASEFVEAFFRRHPNLKRYVPSKVVDKAGGGGSHPEARQNGRTIELYPKFWKLDARTRDFVFTHELGHWVLSEYGLSKLVAHLGELGVDPWDTSSLPFGQFNMDEAFADSFATYFLDRAELHHRYPLWEKAVEKAL